MKKLGNIFKAFSDKNRLRILKLLEKRELCVCELSFVLNITQPSVSRHLKKLKLAGLIKSKKEGFWTVYYLSPENRYAREISALLKSYINDDSVIKMDNIKMRKADRSCLCK